MRDPSSRQKAGVLLVLVGLAVFVTAARAQVFNIFELTNKLWRFDQTNDWYSAGPEAPSDLGWTRLAFDDTTPTWQSGAALLSSDGNAEILPLRNTVLRDFRLRTPPNPALYARTRFDWPGPVFPDSVLRLTCRVDDGVAVYLNGNRVGGLRMGATVTHDSKTENAALVPCVSASGNNDGTCDEIILVNSTFLVSGENVLAVSVHQNNATSSDVTWGCRLDGINPFAPVITDMLQPSNRIVLQTRTTTLHVFADGYPAPTYQWYKDGSAITGETAATLTIANFQAANAGAYFCRVTNSKGEVDSRTADVGYTEDGVPPGALSAAADDTFTRVIVAFSEPLEPMASEDPFLFDVRDPLGNQYGAGEAVLDSSGMIMTVLLGGSMPEDTAMTLEVQGVVDLVGNVMDPMTLNFRTWARTACSGVLMETYNGIGGTALNLLTSNPNFPDRPSETYLINRFHSRAAYPDNSHDNYGARMRALFVPQVSGNWRFFMSTDDNGELWFNPGGSSAAGRVRIAREGGCCGLYSPPGDPRTSDAFPLVAGQGYYIELLYKEGGGGDYGSLAARLDGTGIPLGGSDQSGETNEVINGVFVQPDGQIRASLFCSIAAGAAPAGAAGSLGIVQNPADLTIEAVTTAHFSVGVSAPDAPFVCYQWQRSDDGGSSFTDIAGATTSSYSKSLVTVADDNGDQYRVVVSIPGRSLTSAPATLTVTSDMTRPVVTMVLGTGSNAVSVFYSEPMNALALNPANYTLNAPASVTSATVNAGNSREVDLVLSAGLIIDSIYELRIANVTDPAGNPLDPDPTLRTFRAQVYTGDIGALKVLPAASALPLGSLTTRGMLGRVVQVAAVIANDNAVTEQLLAGVYPSAASALPNIAPEGAQLFLETGAINYNRDVPTPTSVGRLVPDLQFPGYPLAPSTVSYENMAMEVLTYLELRQGIHRMGVSSDDGFRVSPAVGVEDTNNAIVLGEFNGGRGVADTTFDFVVPTDGLYPFRLTWEQGQGGANVDWWVQSLVDNSYQPVNGPSGGDLLSGGGLLAGAGGGGPPGWVPPCAPKVLSIALNGNNVVVSWPVAMGGNQWQLQQAAVLANPASATVWVNTPQVPKVVMGLRTVTVPVASAPKFYRLFRPAPCP